MEVRTASTPWSLDRSLGVSTDGKLASFLFYDAENEWRNIVVLFNTRLDDTASRGILGANTLDVVEACARAADVVNGQPQHRYCNLNIAGIVFAIHLCQTFIKAWSSNKIPVMWSNFVGLFFIICLKHRSLLSKVT